MDPRLYTAVRCGDENFIREVQNSDKTTLPTVIPQTGTVLHVAARFRRTPIAKMILEWHPLLLRQKNSEGDTPLHIAARIGDSDMVRFLVNHKVAEIHQEVDEADEKLVLIVNMKGETALHDAVRGDHLEVVMLLIEKDPLLATLTAGGGESPLFLAVERMHIQVAKHILSILSDDAPSCSFQGRNGMNALHAAIIRGCKLDFIKELLGKMSPSAILEGDNSGWTALHHAACLGEQLILDELLSTDKSNSISYARDKKGMTALHIAAKEGRVDIMQKLAQKCPDIWGSVDSKGQTALHVAAKIGKTKIVEFILKEVPDDIINRQDKEGNSSLHLAALAGNFGVVDLLIEDRREDKTAINSKGVAFMDILLSVKNPLPSKAKVIECGVARRLASLERVINKINKQGMSSVNEVEHTKKVSEQPQERCVKPSKNNIPDVEDNEVDKQLMEVKELAAGNVVVATLIASVSFTAAVTMPGGYKADGPHAGMAILGNNASFKAFVITNSLAFAFSLGSLFAHFFTFRGQRILDPQNIKMLIFYSLVPLLIAFMSCSHAVLADYQALSVAVLVLTPVLFVAVKYIYSPLEEYVGELELPFLGTWSMANLRGLSV